MTILTVRSQLALYWSTAPALVGYPDSHEQMIEAREALLSGKPDFRGTARAILARMRRVKFEVGGASVAFFIRTPDGRDVDVDELREVVMRADMEG